MLETTSFDDVQIAVYRGSRAIEIDLDPKKVCFDDVQIAMYRGS